MLPAAPLRPSTPARRLLPWLLALATATCSTDRTGPGTDGRGYFGFRPVYQLAEGMSLSQFGIVADTVRVRITRPIDQVVIDTAVVFPADSSSLSLALPVELEASPELLDVVITISAQGQIIFVDSLQVDVVDGPPGSTTPPTVVFEYIGPGNNIALVDITPEDTTITFGDTVFFASTAEDSSAAPVTTFYLSWTSSDSNVAKVNGAGRVVAGGTRGTAEIVGLTPTGISDTSTVTIAPSPVIITADSGIGQQAQVTDSVPELFVARVKGADSLGISGVPVRFQAVTAGGAVRDTLVITDATGRARTRGVVGDTARTYTYTATAVGTGLPAATFAVNALTEAPTVIVKQSGDAQTDTINKVLPLPFVVLVTDAFGNPVVGAGVVFTRTVGTGTLADDTVFTVGGGTASVGYTLGSSVGADSIRAQIVGTSAFVDFTANAISATPVAVDVDSGDAQSAAASFAFADSLVVRVLDGGANPVAGATVQWDEETGSVTLSGVTSITGADGRARIGVTAGTVAEPVTVLATIAGVADTASFALTIIPGAPASMTIASGNNQSGTEGLPLPLWPEVQIGDAFNNPIAGLTVNFAVVAGGGTIDSATATTDSTGRANSGEWTLGSPGLNTVRAVASSVPADTLLFDATATPAGTSKLWTAAVNTAWDNAGNWSPSGIPTASDNVFIPSAPSSPVVSVATGINDLIVESGATVTLGAITFNVAGDAEVFGVVAGTGTLNLTGAGTTFRGTTSTALVLVNGTPALSGSTSINGPLTINAGTLNVSGQDLAISGALTIQGTGLLFMTNAADSVDVGGNFTVNSSSNSTGSLTAGTLVLRGNFTQTAGAFENFAATGSHLTRFVASAPRTISFSSPSATQSHFARVDFDNPSGITLSSSIVATGQAAVLAGTVTGVARTAFLSGSLVTPYAAWQVSTTRFDAAPSLYPDSLPRHVQLNSAWALSHDFKTDSSFNVLGGAALVLGGNKVRVGTSMTQTGELQMTSVADTLEVNGAFTVNSSDQGISDLTEGLLILRGNLTQTAGAFENFQPSLNHTVRLAGSTPQALSFSAPNPAQSRFQHVEFANPAGVTLSTSISILGDATVTAGTVTGVARTTTHFGDLVTSYGAWQVSTTRFEAAPTVYPDSLPRHLVLNVPWTLSHPFKVDSGWTTTGSGDLTLGGFALRVGTSFTQTGALRMTDPADTLTVGGAFAVNSSAQGIGDLTEGLLIIGGNFSQTAGAFENFQASGNHITRFAGSAPQTVTFSAPNPSQSRFWHAEFANAAGVTFNSNFSIYGSATVTAGTVTGNSRTVFFAGSLTTPYAAWQVATTRFDSAPTAYPDSLPRHVVIAEPWTLAHDFKVDSTFTITSAGALEVGGNHLRIGTGFTQTGEFRMLSAADTVDVGGAFTVNSSQQGIGHLSDGLLILRGNFTQTSGAFENFQPSGTHLTRFAGAALQAVSFSAFSLTQSRFNDVEFANAANVQFNTSFSVAGTATTVAGQAVGATRTATLAGSLVTDNTAWQIGTTVFTATPGIYPDSLPQNVTVSDTFPLTHPFTVGGNLLITGSGVVTVGGQVLTVGGTMTQTGTFVMTNAADSVDIGGHLTVNSAVNGIGDLTDGVLFLRAGFTQTAGAFENFAPDNAHRTIFGGTGGHAISFSSTSATTSRFNNLVVADSMTLNSGLTAIGPVSMVGTGRMMGPTRTATLHHDLTDPTFLGWRVGNTIVAAPFRTLPVSLTTNLTLSDTFFVAAPMSVTGNMTLNGNAYLNLTGHALTVTGNFTQSANLGMFATGDSLDVGGDFLVNSSEDGTGDLAAGVIRIGGNFTQTSGAFENYIANAPHRTVFHNAALRTISISAPTISQFGELAIEGGATLALATDVRAEGSLNIAGGPVTVQAAAQRRITTTGLAVDGATFDRVRIEMHSVANAAQFDNVTFLNQDPTRFQLSLEVPGQTGDTIRLNNVSFNGTPTTGGYLMVADSVANDAPSTIGLYNSSPLNGSLFTTVEGSVGDTPEVRWSELIWETQPTAATELLPWVTAPEVAAVDPSGVIMTSFTGTVTLAFFTDPSGGSALLANNSVAAVNGIATFDALTVSLAGVGYQFQGSATGLGLTPPSDPFTVDIPLPSGTTTVFNNGGGDNDWFNPANWTAGLPDSADNVYIIPSQTAVLGSFARVGHLALGAGASLVLNNNLAVDSSIVAGNTISGGGLLYAQGTGELSGSVGQLVVLGQYTVPTGDQLTAQSINISGPLATLDPGQAQITAIDSLWTEAGGRLNIGYPGASVTVQGLARFGGGASALTDGTLYLGGDFVQEVAAGAFSPTTGFNTVFNGGGIQNVAFSSPDSIGDRFWHVGVENGSVVNFTGVVPVTGDLSVSSGTVNILGVTTVYGDINGPTGAELQGGGTLRVATTLNFGGPYAVATTWFIGFGQTIPALAAPYDTLVVAGTAALGTTVDAGTVRIPFGGNELDINGQRLNILGDMELTGGGTLKMVNAADSVFVGGNFLAAGGSTTGLLTSGLLQITGSFSQTAAVVPDAFRADSGHTTRFDGPIERVINFESPVVASDPFSTGNSRFGRLELLDGIDSLGSSVAAVEEILVASGAVTNLSLAQGGLGSVGNITVLPGVVQFDIADVQLGGVLDFQPPTPVYQAGTTLFFGSGQSIPALPYGNLEVAFGTATLAGDITATGNVKAGISDEGPGFPGHLDLGGHALTVSGDFVAVGLGTFAMQSPADSLDVTGSINLEGAPSLSITDGVILARGDFTMTDSAFIATGNHRVVFAAPVSQQLWVMTSQTPSNQFNRLFVSPGTTVNYNQFFVGPLVVADTMWVNGFFQQAAPAKKIIVQGDLYAGAAAGIIVDTVELGKELEIDASMYTTQLTRYTGSGFPVAGNVSYNVLEITGASFLDTSVVANEVRVTGSGNLDIGAFDLAAATAFRVLDDATIQMGDPAGIINTDTAQFAGGNSDGLLTAGTLRARTLRQESTTSTRSYRATGTHITEIGTPLGGPNYEINFQSGGPVGSQIQDLSLNDGGVGGVATVIVGNVPVAGRLVVASEGSGGVVGGAGSVLMVGDSLINNGQIDFAVDTMELWGGIQTDPNTLANVVTRFAGSGQLVPDSQGYLGVEVTGNVGLESAANIQTLRILGTGQLTITGFQQVSVSGDFTTLENGTLAMNGTSPSLFVFGTTTFGGGSSVGLLTAGIIRVFGDFEQIATNSSEPFTTTNTGVIFQGSSAPQVVTIDPASFGLFRGVGITNPNGIVINGNMVVTDSVGTAGPITGDSLSQFGNFFMNPGSSVGVRVLKTGGLFSGTPGSYTVDRTHIVNPNSLPNVVFDTLVINAAGVSTFFPLFASEVIVAGLSSPFSTGGAAVLDLGVNNFPTRSSTTGSVTVEGLNAMLLLAEDTLDIGGEFRTALGGRVTMADPTGSLEVGTNAVFDGGSTEGLLTAGRLFINGDLTQPGNGSPSAFVTNGATVELYSFSPHNIAFADPDSSFLPELNAPSTLTLNIIGRARIAGDLSSGILNLTGDSLWIEGQLSPGGATSISLQELRVFSLYQFMNIVSFAVGTGHLIGPTNLPFNDFAFDSLFVHDTVYGQLSQTITTNYLEVAGPGNPRHLGSSPGYFYLDGGDGNTFIPVNGDVVVRGAGARIQNSQGRVQATGTLTVDQGGVIGAIGGPFDGTYDFDGDVLIDGASTAGELVSGSLIVGGSFTQLATLSAESYAPDPSFTTKFKFGGTHTVNFATPGAAGGGGSYFGTLEFSGDAGLVLETATDLWVEGQLVDTAFGTPTLRNTAPVIRTLTIRDVWVEGLVFDHLQLRLQKSGAPAGGISIMDNVTFTNFFTTEDQFVVELPGISGNFVWSNFTWTQLDTGGGDSGRYIVATDNDGPSPNVLNIQIGTNQSGDPSNYFVGLNGAVVNPFSP